MDSKRADIKADIGAVVDDGENTSLMMPLLIGEGSRHRAELTDLAIELAARSARADFDVGGRRDSHRTLATQGIRTDPLAEY